MNFPPEVVKLCSSIINSEVETAQRIVLRAGGSTDRTRNAVIPLQSTYETAIKTVFSRISNDIPVEVRVPTSDFWSFVGTALKERILSSMKSVAATVKTSNIERYTNRDGLILSQVVSSSTEEHINRDLISNRKGRKRDLTSPDVAVMMWFPNKETHPEEFKQANERYEIYKEVVKQTTNETWKVNKLNDPEVLPRDRISSDVERWISNSRITIIDLTGDRRDVYYEFGFARGSNIRTLSICPREMIDGLPAHVKSIPHIVFTNLEELKEELKSKMVTAFGELDKN